jgi:hypothetical protein
MVNISEHSATPKNFLWPSGLVELVTPHSAWEVKRRTTRELWVKAKKFCGFEITSPSVVIEERPNYDRRTQKEFSGT